MVRESEVLTSDILSVLAGYANRGYLYSAGPCMRAIYRLIHNTSASKSKSFNLHKGYRSKLAITLSFTAPWLTLLDFDWGSDRTPLIKDWTSSTGNHQLRFSPIIGRAVNLKSIIDVMIIQFCVLISGLGTEYTLGLSEPLRRRARLSGNEGPVKATPI